MTITNAQLLVDWEKILATFERLSDKWVFRGQVDSRWELNTSLERHTPPDLQASDAESTILDDFRRRAHTYLSVEQLPANDGDTAEWLALMQHFGAPTRLLDVTHSPYVALYFAVEEVVRDVGCCAVWAIDKSWCLESAGDLILQANPEAQEKLRRAIESRPQLKTMSLGLYQGLESSKLKGDRWRPKRLACVVPYRPQRYSERLSIQQGEFLVPRHVDMPFMDNLRAHRNSSDHVVQYLIPNTPEVRGRIIERLRVMNITRAQLFPGLDGFAQSFRQRLIREPEDAKLERLGRGVILEDLQIHAEGEVTPAGGPDTRPNHDALGIKQKG